jgi:AraC-like DNA-binding protein
MHERRGRGCLVLEPDEDINFDLMSSVVGDRRTWSGTDRPGESVSIARPFAGIELVSVRGSHRHWREAHESFTLAVIHRTQNRVVADWRTRARALCTEGGDIMAIEPGDTHVTERLKLEGGAADFDIVRFAPGLVADAARSLGSAAAFHFSTPAVKDSPTFDALCKLVAVAAVGGDSLEIGCASAAALHLLVSRLAERAPRSVPPLDPVRDYRLRRVRDYLRSHLDKRPGLSELETVADLGQFRLCYLFKRAYGVSIGQYWNALRLAEAVRRLQLGKPVKMIVSELGYTDEPYFSRLFKAHYGVAPGGWLSVYRANDRLARR